MERGNEGECGTRGTKPETSPLGVWESGTGNKASERPARGWVVPWEGSSPLSQSWTVSARRQWQGLGSQPQAAEQKASMPKQLPAGRSLRGREGSWLCLLVHSQLWPGVLWDRAHPGKPLTFSRTVRSLDRSQRHHKGPIQRLPRPPAASSGGLDISFQSCRDPEDLQVTPPMTKSRKFPQNSAFIATMTVHTYNPRTHWLKQENWPKSEPMWAMQ